MTSPRHVGGESEVRHLLLARDTGYDIRALAQRIAPILGDPPTDLATQLRYSSGIIATDLLSDVADEILAALEALDLEALSIAADEFAVVRPEVVPVRSVEWRPGEDTVVLEARRTKVELDRARLGAADLALFGSLADDNEAESSTDDWELRAMAEVVPFEHAEARKVFLDQRESATPIADLYDREHTVYRIERGTAVVESGEGSTRPWNENFLLFWGAWTAELDAMQLSDRARRFWENPSAETILVSKAEELTKRREWISTLLAIDRWNHDSSSHSGEPDQTDDRNGFDA